MKRFGMIEIERKTDILALAAFLIALGGVLVQVIGFFRGSELELFSPYHVLVHYEDPKDCESLVRFSAVMAYTNTGQVGYNGIVQRELLKYTIGSQSYVQVWQKFIESDEEHLEGRNTGELSIKPVGIAAAFAVNAGDSKSHETHYYPAPERLASNPNGRMSDRNYISKAEFENMIGVKGHAPLSMLLEFVAETSRDNRLVVACRIRLDDGFREVIRSEGWTVVRCWESEDRSELQLEGI